MNNNDKVIATTITDGGGHYNFAGLPDGTYTIWVNDSFNMLNKFAQTSRPNNSVDGGQPCGLSCNGRNTITVSSASGNGNQDFGYIPINPGSGTGLIGDTIFLDANGNGSADPGEGMGGVIVELLDSTGNTLLSSTTTNANGQYFFGNLPAGTYVVRVAVPTPIGYTNSHDHDGGTANETTVVLAAGEVNLSQDFGYQGTGTAGSIGNLVWNDLNANGHQDAGETGIDGVTVEIYQDRNDNGVLDTGDFLVGTTTTSGGGVYIFNNLATNAGSGNAKYLVHVTDTNGVLSGWWNSSGDNTQIDPYVVTLTPAAPSVINADFGYFHSPASIGDFVWNDKNGNGIQDSGEQGLSGVPVTLLVGYANGTNVSLITTTNGSGLYSFANLLSDENLSGTGAGQPTFTISVAIPSGFVSSPIHAGGNPALDSGNPAGT